MSQVVEKFKETCDLYKEKPAIVFEKKGKLIEKTFGELNCEVEMVAAYLRQKGVHYGDKILTFATPSYDLCVFMLASMSIGASLMYVDSWANQQRLRSAFSQYRPDFVLVSKATSCIRFLFREIYSIKKVLYVDAKRDLFSNASVSECKSDISENTVAILTLTTGSTGNPKAAIRTHRLLHEQLMLVCNNVDVSDKNEYVLTTSFMYVFANLLNGLTTVLPRLRLGKSSTAKLDRQLSIFLSLPISTIITTPDFCLSVSNRFSQLKRLYVGGAILSIYEAETIQNKFKPAEVNYIYGATECNLITMTRLDEYISSLKDGVSVLGEAVKGVQIHTNDNFEIMVSGKAILEQYLMHSEGINKERDKNQILWHKTGDAGELQNGKLVYFGRCDKKLPFKTLLYSSQLEQDICVHFSTIKKCAVCSDNTNPQKIWIFVVCSDGKRFDLSTLHSYVKEKLPNAELAVKRLRKMPCDVKHHTKINYNALQKKIKSRKKK